MPHIIIEACDTDKCMQMVQLVCRVHFKKEYFHSPKAELKMEELRDKLVSVVEEYFPFSVSMSDVMSNHEFNSITK